MKKTIDLVREVWYNNSIKKGREYMGTVYDAFTRRIVFEGTVDECLKWIMDQAFTFEDGRKLYRTWQENGDCYYDVGTVYVFNK